MPYKAELNRFTGRSRLVYYATIKRTALGKKGAFSRRVVEIDGRSYHVTKGWRGKAKTR